MIASSAQTVWRITFAMSHCHADLHGLTGKNRGLIKVSRLYKCIYNILIYMV